MANLILLCPHLIRDYSYDAIGRRENVRNSGTAFNALAFSLYNYNDRSELVEANRYQGTDITDTSNPVNSENRTYGYDNIGNRKDAMTWDKAESVQEQMTYTANQLNQYELIEKEGQQSVAPTYDLDGNMTGLKNQNYKYNAENRLIAVEPKIVLNGDTKVEFRKNGGQTTFYGHHNFEGTSRTNQLICYSRNTEVWSLWIVDFLVKMKDKKRGLSPIVT